MFDSSMHTASPPAPHVLAVDDDPAIRQLVSDYLTGNELRVTTVASGTELTAVMERDTIDLVLLDLRLQGEDGMQIARRLRESSAIPILMLTGRADEADRVMGLELGADDYLTKPFSPRELLARIRALLRRAKAQATVADEIGKVRAYRFGTWELSVGLRKLKAADGRSLGLTNGEFSLLAAFLSARSASSRAISFSIYRGFTTRRSTIARSTCRSCDYAARSKSIRRIRGSSQPSAASVMCSTPPSK